METGTVKFFNEAKGFGFIERQSGKDVFVHATGIVGGPISDGDRVEFEIGEGKKGPCAVEVRVLR